MLSALSGALSWSLLLCVPVWQNVTGAAPGAPGTSAQRGQGWVSHLVCFSLCSQGLWPHLWSQTATHFVHFPSAKTQISRLILPFTKQRDYVPRPVPELATHLGIMKVIDALLSSMEQQGLHNLWALSSLIRADKHWEDFKRGYLRVGKETQRGVWIFVFMAVVVIINRWNLS